MITAQDALEFAPQKAGMNGYRATEVDQFISEVAQTLDFYEKKIRDLQNKINELKQNETIIQTTLVNAQKLAMQITEEAKSSAEQVTAEAAAKAAEETAEAHRQANAIVGEATAKARKLDDETGAIAARIESEAKETAAKLIADAEAEAARIAAKCAADTERENLLLDALRTEVAKFRTDVLNMYKEQVTLIRDLPDMMPEVTAVVSPAPAEAEEETETETEAAVDAEPQEETAGVDLLKIMSDMNENERAAAEAVDEVASMSDAPIEGQVMLTDLAADEKTPLQFNAEQITEDDSDDSSDDIPVMPVTKREGGFTVRFDDDDDEE